MNVSSGDIVCAYSESLYFDNPYMRWIFVTESVLDVLAILSISILTICAFFDSNLHFNVRVLLVCLCSALMVANIGGLLNSLYYLSAVALRRPKELCNWLTFTKADCLALKQVYNLGIVATVLSSLIFSIERTIASLLSDSYVIHSRRWLGFTLAAVQWLLTIPAVLYGGERESESTLQYCARELFEPNAARNVQLTLIVAQTCGMITLIVLWHHNVSTLGRRGLKGSDLSVQRELRETLSVGSVMPMVILNGVLIASAAALFALFLPYRSNNAARQPAIAIDKVNEYALYAEAQACVLPAISILLLFFTQRNTRHVCGILRQAAGLDYFNTFDAKTSVEMRRPRHDSPHLEPLEKRWNALFSSDFVIDPITIQSKEARFVEKK